MKKTQSSWVMVFLAVLIVVSVVSCAPKNQTNTQAKTVSEETTPISQEVITEQDSTEKSVSAVDSDIAGIDTLDQDLETEDLNSLDSDLNYKI